MPYNIFWKLTNTNTIKNLSGSKTNINRTAIKFGDRQHTEGKKCAKEFCKQFVEHPTTQNKCKRATLRTIRNLSIDRQWLSFSQSDVANDLSINDHAEKYG